MIFNLTKERTDTPEDYLIDLPNIQQIMNPLGSGGRLSESG